MPQAFYIFAIAASLFSIVAKASTIEVTEAATSTKAATAQALEEISEQEAAIVRSLLQEQQTAQNDYTVILQIKDGKYTVQKTAL